MKKCTTLEFFTEDVDLLCDGYYDTLDLISHLKRGKDLTDRENEILILACREVRELTGSLLKYLLEENELPESLNELAPVVVENYSFILRKYIEVSGGSVY